MILYKGYRVGGASGQPVFRNEEGKIEPLSVAPSQAVRNHASEFNWGYDFIASAAQLALALLLDVTGDTELSVRLHQDFKRTFVAQWGDQWSITDTQIKNWLSRGHQKEAITLEY
jgi:hypothetical protein